MTTETTARRRDGERLDQARLLVGLVAVALLGVLVWAVFDSRGDADREEQEKLTLAQQVTVACDSGGPGARELEQIGACDQAATAAVGSPAGEQLDLPAATDRQVRLAVADYLGEHPPRDGRTPTAAEVEAAVTRVCDAIGCRGTDGEDGQNGADGADGADASDAQVAGQVAAYCADNNDCLPTVEEIQAAVAAYCSTDPSPCMGPAGTQGIQGEPGPVLPEYYETDGPLTRHCVLQPPTDAGAPPSYRCTLE